MYSDTAHLKFLFVFLIIPILLLLALGIYNLIRPAGLQDVKKWVILLSYDPSTQDIKSPDIQRYDMAILDPDFHPPMATKDNGRTIFIAYVSLGEAESYRSYWDSIKGSPFLLKENPNWRENYYVDVRNKRWQEIILDDVIPSIVAQGFDGIMMDTIDTAAFLQGQNAVDYAGSEDAMISFIRKIRARYPKLLLISNNGFAVLERIAGYIDGMLVEDIHMMIDFANAGYMRVPDTDRDYKVDLLKKMQEAYRLPVFVIDYAPSENRPLIRELIDKNKKLGFKPYIAERDLDAIYKN